MAVNFTKNQDEISKSWREVVDSKSTQKWALYGYEGNTNNIKLISTGSHGLKELVVEFNCSLIQYAFCRVINNELGINKLVLINWQGDSAPLSRKGLCASHVGDVANYFKGCAQTITIRNDDEATEEYLMDQIVKTSSSRVSLSRHNNDSPMAPDGGDLKTAVGSTYKKTDIRSEISSDRKSFWQRQEEEEKERLIEEKKRAAEKQAQFEKERKLREELEAKKLAETILERDRIIEATRRADRREPSSVEGSQPSSILSLNANQDTNDDDDERVGRRSELIRRERNQETLSLISKGLIKNKRAIFEQASHSQQQQPQPISGNNLTRRTSEIIAQRLNTFKSLDGVDSSAGSSGRSSVASNVDKLTNGFVKHVNLESNEGPKSIIVRKEVETVAIVNDEPEHVAPVSSTTGNVLVDSNIVSSHHPADIKKSEVVDSVSTPQDHVSPSNGNTNPAIEHTDSNGSNNNDQYKSNKNPKQESKSDANEITLNGKLDIRAKALYDYQAADNTEISFDPDDIIGAIVKVDKGWWHGSVVTGKYSGQTGLFPANYVEEL